MRALLSLLLSIALGCSAPAASQPAVRAPVDPARKARLSTLAPHIDEYLHVRRAALRATGAVLGIVLDGELAYVGAVGLRDAERNDAVDADTVFRMASLTKSVTALAVLKLRDEGKLGLDAPVADYVPALRLVGLAADAPQPSIRQLLTMTSGLPRDDEWAAVTRGYDEQALDALLAGGIALSSAPGERFAYSNLGYALLGRAIAAASGEAYREYVSESILTPLGMRASVWEAADVPPQRLAIGYRREREALLAAERPSDGEFAAAGGLYTSVRDYARFMAYQLGAYPARSGPERGPVRRSTLREMHAGQRAFRWGGEAPIARVGPDGRLALSAPSYGFGWVSQSTCAYDGIVQHGGVEPGYFAYARLLPREALGLVAFSTTAALGDYETFEHLLGMLRDAKVLERSELPAPAPALTVAADAVTRLLGRWDDALAQRSIDPQSSRPSWLAQLQARFEALRHTHGACKPEGPLRSEEASSARFRLACARGALELELWLTPGLPQRVQVVHVRQELPPGETLDALARELVRLLGTWDDAAASTFSSSLDLRRLKNELERLGLEHGSCSLARPLASDGSSEARYLLACARAPLELGFRVDEAGKVAWLSSSPHVPQRAEGACSNERVLGP